LAVERDEEAEDKVDDRREEPVVVGVEEEEEGETGDGDEDDKESLSESV
jgi:hypothetical protein